MKKVYKSILAATIALSTTMSIVTGFAANNDKEKNQENNSAITYNAGNEIKAITVHNLQKVWIMIYLMRTM